MDELTDGDCWLATGWLSNLGNTSELAFTVCP